MNLRQTPVTIAAVGVAAALAFTTPVVAKAAFDARNAHRVDGLHANQLTKIQYFETTTTFDDFNTCSYTTVLSRPFTTKHAGVVAVHGAVSSARDTDDPDEGILTGRILIDGNIASVASSVNLENDGSLDATVVNFGARKVASGVHTLELQVKECGNGMAFITSQSMLASYSPFGGAAVPPVTKTVVKANN